MPAEKCSWCAGSTFEFSAEADPVPCSVCDGGGFSLAETDLGPTRSCPKGRPATFDPGNRVLTVFRRGKPTRYLVSEVTPDLNPGERPFRVFQCEKADGERHHQRFGEGFCDCDCKGKVYGASAKADRWNWMLPLTEQEEEYETLGCVHLDAVAWALRDGLLDVERPVGFDTANREF